MFDVAAFENGFLGVGQDGQGPAVWRSSDGRSWQRDAAAGQLPTRAAGRMSGVTRHGDAVIAVGSQRGGPARVWIRETVTVSVMPNVVGVDLSVATSRVLAAGVSDIRNEERDQPGAQQCLVYAQEPAAGTPLAPGTVVTLYSYSNLGECGRPVP